MANPSSSATETGTVAVTTSSTAPDALIAGESPPPADIDAPGMSLMFRDAIVFAPRWTIAAPSSDDLCRLWPRCYSDPHAVCGELSSETPGRLSTLESCPVRRAPRSAWTFRDASGHRLTPSIPAG